MMGDTILSPSALLAHLAPSPEGAGSGKPGMNRQIVTERSDMGMKLMENRWILVAILIVFIAVWTYLSYTRGFLPQNYFPVY